MAARDVRVSRGNNYARAQSPRRKAYCTYTAYCACHVSPISPRGVSRPISLLLSRRRRRHRCFRTPLVRSFLCVSRDPVCVWDAVVGGKSLFGVKNIKPGAHILPYGVCAGCCSPYRVIIRVSRTYTGCTLQARLCAQPSNGKSLRFLQTVLNLFSVWGPFGEISSKVERSTNQKKKKGISYKIRNFPMVRMVLLYIYICIRHCCGYCEGEEAKSSRNLSEPPLRNKQNLVMASKFP